MTIGVAPRQEFVYLGTRITVYGANKGEGLPEHSHFFDHVASCQAGSCVVRVNKKEFVLTPVSRPVVLPALIPHEIEALEDGTVFTNILPK